MKKVFIIFSITFILLCFPVAVIAHEEPSVSLVEFDRYYVGVNPALTSTVTVALRFENGRGIMGGHVIAQPRTTTIMMDAILRRNNSDGTTTYIRGWYGMTRNATALDWNANWYVNRGHDYTLTLYVTTVRDGRSYTTSVSRTARA